MVFGVVESLITSFVDLLTSIVSSIGYTGVFILMALESAALPVPSEVVMPFAGYLATQGVFNIWTLTLIGSLANLAGSLVAYYVGLFFGRRFILKYGKYVLLKEKILFISEDWFKRYGERSVFFSRLLPVIRTFISIPAGIGRMDMKKFILYTFIGSVPWNFALTYSGFWLGQNWKLILEYFHWITLATIIAVLIGLWYIVFKKRLFQ